VVFVGISDPEGVGIVANLAKPGGCLLIIIFWLLNLSFAKSTWEAAGLSVVDTFRIFGVKEEFLRGIDSNMPIGLRILAAVQTIVGSALVFLFLLALQKKFRMK
jgi:hypothetical protein